MKKLILIILLVIPIRAIAPQVSEFVIADIGGTNPLELLWRATCLVESNNDVTAFNAKEGACGVAQIRECRIRHFNSLTGKNYKLKDCFNPEVSKEVFMWFATEDLEKTSRKWNGSGKMTDKYWNKIKARL